jgi:hypothetical protein
MNTPQEKDNQALVAIVDDDQSFREALDSLLRLIGFRTAISLPPALSWTPLNFQTCPA